MFRTKQTNGSFFCFKECRSPVKKSCIVREFEHDENSISH